MAANLMLRTGIDAAGGFAFTGLCGTVSVIARLSLQPAFAAGFVIYFLASVVWFRIVATEPLTLAYPVLVSLTFASVAAGALYSFSANLFLCARSQVWP